MSNLPPGVNEGDIPGNRPEDIALDQIIGGEIGGVLQHHALDITEIGQEPFVKAILIVLSRYTRCYTCGKMMHLDSVTIERTNEWDYGISFCSESCVRLYETEYC